MSPKNRLALVGWCADTGVGRELVDAARHLNADSAFILRGNAPTRPELVRDLLTPTFASGRDLYEQMDQFLDACRPSTVLTWETPGSWTFPALWKRRGVRWVHVVHWDWFSDLPAHIDALREATLVAPNEMCQRGLLKQYELASTLLPVPVDTELLSYKERLRAERFISIFGLGTPDRRSLPQLMAAWRAMKDPPPLTLKAQTHPGGDGKFPPGMKVEVSRLNEPADLYADGDVAVQLSRYEGVGLSLLEAQARGMPVITVDAPPMTEIVHGPKVKGSTDYIAILGRPVAAVTPSVDAIVEAVTKLRGQDILELSRAARELVVSRFSWGKLRDAWVEILKAKP